MEFSKLIRNFITNKTTLARTVRYFWFIALTVLLTWENDFIDELRDIGTSSSLSYIFNDSFFNTLSILLYTWMYLITWIWSIFYIIYLFSTYRKSHNQEVSPKEIILFFIKIIFSIVIILIGALFWICWGFAFPRSLHIILIITIFSFAISLLILFWKDQKTTKKWYITLGVSITVFFLVILIQWIFDFNAADSFSF